MRLVMLAIFAALNLFVAPVTAEAQAQKIFRVGYLGGGSPSPDQSISIGFVRGLRDQGYVEGQNLAIDYRWTRGTNEGFPALAAELVTLKVDVIVAHATPAVLAAKAATTTIPIVLLNVADPVGAGLVTSLARPDGNVTGVSNQGADFTGKLLELSKEIVPRLARVVTITPIPGPATHARVKELETAASTLMCGHRPGVSWPMDRVSRISGIVRVCSRASC